MAEIVLADSGAIVAALDRRDQPHAWAQARFAAMAGPLTTCEAVLSECFFLLEHLHDGSAALCRLLGRGVIRVDFSFVQSRAEILRLIGKYESVPMSFADACLVRLSELQDECAVFATDSDFRIYRRNGRQAIPLIAPR